MNPNPNYRFPGHNPDGTKIINHSPNSEFYRRDCNRIILECKKAAAEREELERAKAEGRPPEKTEIEMPDNLVPGAIVRRATNWMSSAAKLNDLKPLYDSLWYEGEVCCLFGDTNTGKSILCVQIANDIARNHKVLYFDFELSERQFYARYKDYELSWNLLRAEMNPVHYAMQTDFATYDDYVLHTIEQSAKEYGAEVLILDNLTYICNNSEKGDAAGELMRRLLELKKANGWSILVVGHTNKRDLFSPITENQLNGSKRLMNFFDSSFAVARSVETESRRYIKQIKCRNSSIKYGSDNVIVANIERDENGMLRFISTGFSKEEVHLDKNGQARYARMRDNIIELSLEGKSQNQIAKELGLSKRDVNRVLKEYQIKQEEAAKGNAKGNAAGNAKGNAEGENSAAPAPSAETETVTGTEEGR